MCFIYERPRSIIEQRSQFHETLFFNNLSHFTIMCFKMAPLLLTESSTWARDNTDVFVTDENRHIGLCIGGGKGLPEHKILISVLLLAWHLRGDQAPRGLVQKQQSAASLITSPFFFFG
jgi:hypothetical protein